MFIFQTRGHNDIFIHTEKQQYYAGETINGTVYLTVATQLNLDSINIKVSGYEKAEFDYRESRQVPAPTKENPNATRTEQYTRHACEEKTFFKRKYVLYSARSTMLAGQYAFPFQLTLDANLPGTFSMNHRSENASAQVRYEMRAEIQVPGFFEANIKHYQDILVCQPLRTAILASDTYKESKVTFLCCIPKGTVSLAANIDKNAYAPGEPIVLNLIVDNSQSTVELGSFSFRLERHMVLYARGQHYSDNVVVMKNKCAGVPRGERAQRAMTIQLPFGAEPTTDATLVKCSYELIVELSVPWSPNIRVRQPVQVYAPQLATYSAQITMPAGWAPTVMPMVNLNSVQFQAF